MLFAIRLYFKNDEIDQKAQITGMKDKYRNISAIDLALKNY
jgi:hypothetical protein